MVGAVNEEAHKTLENEITPEMIEAAARVLWNDPFLYHLASLGHCEDLAERALESAITERLR